MTTVQALNRSFSGITIHLRTSVTLILNRHVWHTMIIWWHWLGCAWPLTHGHGGIIKYSCPKVIKRRFARRYLTDIGTCWYWYLLILVPADIGTCWYWCLLIMVPADIGACWYWYLLILVPADIGTCWYWHLLILAPAVIVMQIRSARHVM